MSVRIRDVVIDRDTLEHLPSTIHRLVAEQLIKEGTWKLKDNAGGEK